MSTHVLLNLLNELMKRDKLWGYTDHFMAFCNKFDKFNNTRAQL